MATKPDEDFEEDLEDAPEDLAEEFDEEEIVDEEDIVEDIDDDIDDGDLALVPDTEAEAGDDADVAKPARARKKKAATDEEVDEEDVLDPDDVEADLDTILKDRIAAADDEDDEEEEEDNQAPGEPGGGRVQPMKATEFLCKSCFLVKSVSQRVDGTDDLCNDCV